MTKDLQVFESPDFGKVRTVMVDNVPWFVAKDVCECLEIGNPSQAITRLDEDERNTLILNEGIGNPEKAVVNEYGLYNLILGSRKPEAKAFKRWITHEVLPAIRKTGSYFVPKISPVPSFKSRLVGTAVRDIGGTAKAIMAVFKAKEGIALAKAKSIIERTYGFDVPELEELLPPATHEVGYMNPTQIGEKAGGIKAKQVNALLAANGFQRREGKDWRLNDAGRDYGEEIPFNNHGHSGYQVRWNDSIVPLVREWARTGNA